MVNFVVEAFAENALDPAPENVVVPSCELPTIDPDKNCATLPLNVVVPLAVNIEELEKFPEMERFVEGAVTAPDPDSIKKLVVDAALAPNVFVPGPLKRMLLNALVPIIVPLSACAPAPLKVVVPELCVKVPLFTYAPPSQRYVDGAVTFPEVMVKAPVVVAALASKFHDPVPFDELKVSAEKGVDEAMIVFCCVEVEVNVTVPLMVIRAVDEANQLPASERAFEPMVSMEVVAVPSCRSPVGV